MKIELLEEVSSTNDYIKQYLNGGEDIVVCARRQTGGKGTKGRSFLSGEGGVYLSALRFFSAFPARDAFYLMQHAAVAVCCTAESFGADPAVKWPNDVLVGGKKIAGILIENTFSNGEVKNSVVGIGLNVNNELGELSQIAVNLCTATGKRISTETARDRLIENFCKIGFEQAQELYARRVLLGNATVVTAEESFSATARRVLPDGRLEVDRDGKILTLSAAEVSLKL